LRFESLEKREVMAGNVTAAIVGGSLVISGDDNSNNIEVVGTGVPGEYRIIGHDLVGATLINGAVGPLTIRGVTGGILINARGGNDRVSAHSLTTFGDLSIQGGAGVDYLTVGDQTGMSATRVGVNVVIADLEDGHTAAYMFCTVVGINATIDLADGRNVFTISTANSLPARVGGDVTIRGSADGNVFSLECRNLQVSGDLARAEDDFLWLGGINASGTINVYTYAGNDRVVVTDVRAGAINIDTSNLSGLATTEDHDSVYLNRCRIGATFVMTGAGYDAVEVYNHHLGNVVLLTGSEWDHVTIRDSDIDNFYADLGGGNDSMYFIHSRVWGSMGAFGGNGDDYFNKWGTNLLGGAMSIIDFERRD
jgi:hypothetical protein